DVKPRAIKRFEPWMALSFTEGSIGGDIESISVRSLAAFYGDSAAAAHTSGDADEFELDPSGSNGIAIAPRLTANGHALLWINPHTSFYFRSELQMDVCGLIQSSAWPFAVRRGAMAMPLEPDGSSSNSSASPLVWAAAAESP